MRTVLDTNIVVSSLLIRTGYPAAFYRAWHEGRFVLLTCAEQLDELRATLHKPALAARIKPYKCRPARQRSEGVCRAHRSAAARPALSRSDRRFVLGLSEAGNADYLVTGDKGGLLELARYRSTRIASARDFAALLARPNS
jgi:hypothetical protein